MTDLPIIGRLRHGAENIHSIGPVLAAELMVDAADTITNLKDGSMLLELKYEQDLREIRRVLEEAIGRHSDPARSTVQVAYDAAAHMSAARTYRANMEDSPLGLEAHERPRTQDAVSAHIRTLRAGAGGSIRIVLATPDIAESLGLLPDIDPVTMADLGLADLEVALRQRFATPGSSVMSTQPVDDDRPAAKPDPEWDALSDEEKDARQGEFGQE